MRSYSFKAHFLVVLMAICLQVFIKAFKKQTLKGLLMTQLQFWELQGLGEYRGGGGEEAIERYSPKKKTGKTVKGKGVLHIALY